jgi:hypothetical protein
LRFALNAASPLRADIEAESVVGLERIAGNELGGIGVRHWMRIIRRQAENGFGLRPRGGLRQMEAASVK